MNCSRRYAAYMWICFALVCETAGASTAGQGPRLIAERSHVEGVTRLRYSADGSILLSYSGYDGTWKIWNAQSNRELLTLSAEQCSWVDFGPTPIQFACTRKDGMLRLIGANGGEILHELRSSDGFAGPVVYVADTPFILAMGNDGTLRSVDASDGSVRRTFPKPVVINDAPSYATSSDGRTLAIETSAGVTSFWNVADASPLRAVPRALSTLSLSDSPATVASTGTGRVVEIWDSRSGKLRRAFKAACADGALSGDGKTFACMAGDKLSAWRVANGTSSGRTFSASEGERRQVTLWDDLRPNRIVHEASFSSVALNHDGTLMSAGTSPRMRPAPSPIKHYRMASEKSGGAVEISNNPARTSQVNALAFNRNGLLAVGFGRNVSFWNLNSGIEQRRIRAGDEVNAVAFTSEQGFVVGTDAYLASSTRLVHWRTGNVSEKTFPKTRHGASSHVESLAISEDGKQIIAGGRLFRDGVGHPVFAGTLSSGAGDVSLARVAASHRCPVASVAFADGEKKVVSAGRCRWTGVADTFVSDLATGAQVAALSGLQAPMATHPTLPLVAATALDGALVIWDIEKEMEIGRPAIPGAVTALDWHADGMLVAGLDSGALAGWRPGTQELSWLITEASGPVRKLASGADGVFASVGDDLKVRLWRKNNGALLPFSAGALLFFEGGGWLATAADGRLDGANIDRPIGVHWSMHDDPVNALPAEVYMRDYFQPRLVPRLLAGEKFDVLPPLDKLNRMQPLVKVVAVQQISQPNAGADAVDTVNVVVDVAGGEREFGIGVDKRTMASGAYDLRLFRDGQLVGQWPRAAEQPRGLDVDAEREQWRADRLVVKQADGTRRITFSGIRLPRLPGKDRVEFSAYAFNVDRVKSETARVDYSLPKDRTPRKPVAYVVTFGVNAFQDAAWDLRYAVNDALQSGAELKKQLGALRSPDGKGQYREVVWVPLIADTAPGEPVVRAAAQARKAQVEAVFKTLSGKAVDLRGVPGADRLQRVQPEDLVMLVMSTHGVVDVQGTFYLLPSDIGDKFSPHHPHQASRMRMLARAISTDELAQWMRGMDAVDQVIIIDACHSAASVQSSDFKPGPMGSCGLGQLAYDKGMRILAATQIDQDAVEKDQTKIGLLIYALIEDGLRAGKADTTTSKDGRIMLSEWLNYARGRVPEVFNEVRDGTLAGSKGHIEYSPNRALDAARRAALQQPTLFDFAKGRDMPIMRSLKPSNDEEDAP